jgi:hypothetical protein
MSACDARLRSSQVKIRASAKNADFNDVDNCLPALSVMVIANKQRAPGAWEGVGAWGHNGAVEFRAVGPAPAEVEHAVASHATAEPC